MPRKRPSRVPTNEQIAAALAAEFASVIALQLVQGKRTEARYSVLPIKQRNRLKELIDTRHNLPPVPPLRRAGTVDPALPEDPLEKREDGPKKGRVRSRRTRGERR